MLWGNSDNTSYQGTKDAQIELIKSVAHLTNNKEVFLCICHFTLHWASSNTASDERLLSELEGFHDVSGDKYAADLQVLCDLNFNVACETGIRYPTLPAMLNRDTLLVRISVRFIPCYPKLYHVILGYLILQMGYPD